MSLNSLPGTATTTAKETDDSVVLLATLGTFGQPAGRNAQAKLSDAFARSRINCSAVI